jgi:hypothetical protein
MNFKEKLPQNAGNPISEVLDFKISRGRIPPDPPTSARFSASVNQNTGSAPDPKYIIGQTHLRPFVGFETTRFGNHMCSIESRKYENILIQPIGDLCKEN